MLHLSAMLDQSRNRGIGDRIFIISGTMRWIDQYFESKFGTRELGNLLPVSIVDDMNLVD